jgi:bifunctional UDP-N-acetylglucosamine pyrophosphorylase/glucosamine-1-phosphate N-acetyltransferase
VRAIREDRDCTPAEADVDEVNAGSYCFDAAALRDVLPRLADRNAQRELYLTDAVELLAAAGRGAHACLADDPEEALGVNSLTELAVAREVMQHRILVAHLERGVLIEDPASTYIEHGAEIAPEARILPFTVIRRGVRIGAHCEVGPFAHLRAGTVLHDHAEIGNFVEVKNTTVGARTTAKHLTYLGDAAIGADANIGAGTITANYDGKHKHRTELADRVFVGSGTVFVAPARAGAGASTGAGAIVTRDSDIPAGDVWVGVPARSLRSRKEGGR